MFDFACDTPDRRRLIDAPLLDTILLDTILLVSAQWPANTFLICMDKLVISTFYKPPWEANFGSSVFRLHRAKQTCDLWTL